MIVEEAIVNESLTLLHGTLKPNPCDFLPRTSVLIRWTYFYP
jgi:hypothetical protein